MPEDAKLARLIELWIRTGSMDVEKMQKIDFNTPQEDSAALYAA